MYSSLSQNPKTTRRQRPATGQVLFKAGRLQRWVSRYGSGVAVAMLTWVKPYQTQLLFSYIWVEHLIVEWAETTGAAQSHQAYVALNLLSESASRIPPVNISIRALM